MNKIQSVILITLMMVGVQAYAQQEISVKVVNKEMSRGLQPGFAVNIPEAKLGDIKSAYEKRLEENTKVNAKEINTELISYGVVNKNIALTPFIVYAKLIETIEGVELTAFVTEDSINFINENSGPDKVAAISKSLHDFAVVEYRKVATKQLNAENEKLSELKQKLNSQLSEESSNTKDISRKQREIESYKAKIQDNKVLQASKTEQIGSQQKMIEGFSDNKTPEYELAAKNLKKYQGEKKDLMKDEEKLNRNIDDNNAEIRGLQHENEDLKKQQENSKQSIADQEIIVTKAENKLNGIK